MSLNTIASSLVADLKKSGLEHHVQVDFVEAALKEARERGRQEALATVEKKHRRLLVAREALASRLELLHRGRRGFDVYFEGFRRASGDCVCDRCAKAVLDNLNVRCAELELEGR